MLELLEQEGISFTFPGRSRLLELIQKKLSKIPESLWFGEVQTTITHSLEAFVGNVDFTWLSSQRIFGAQASSPPSTAAYLMHNPIWDEDAEKYLRNVITSRKPDDYGGVSGMYPTTGFEALWIASTLLAYRPSTETLPGISSILDLTDEFYDLLDGLASGISNFAVPDADNTAKSIITRDLLGRPTSADKLLQRFEGKFHFLTYMMERHPSLTTNCNVLGAMLESPEPTKYMSQINKCANSLWFLWTRSDVLFVDKWNISVFYPIMLMSESLIRLLNFWDRGIVKPLPDGLIHNKIPLVLFQALLQTLQKQNIDGSWSPKPSREITAYTIIALANLVSLPFVSELAAQIESAIDSGRLFITTNEQIPIVEVVESQRVSDMEHSGIGNRGMFINMKKDEYFDVIAMSVTCANNLRGHFLKPDVLFNMMSLVLRVYQLNEYVEHVIGREFACATPDVKQLIDNMFEDATEEKGLDSCSSNTLNINTDGHANRHSSRFKQIPKNGFPNIQPNSITNRQADSEMSGPTTTEVWT
ncbi:MAG: hypothetical protein Q9164_004008 [Protoblastenia rupestris]